MRFDDSLADRQTDPGARIFFLGMQPIENFKNARQVFWFYPDAVVTDGEQPFGALLLGRDVDAGCLLPAEFQRIGHKILKDQSKLARISLHDWQKTDCHHPPLKPIYAFVV
jgi:hypothetical protein